MLFLTSIAQLARATLMPLAVEPITRSDCRCFNDEQLETLVALINQGFNQWDASVIVFGGSAPRAQADKPVVWRARALLEVRQLANVARRSLGLRLIPETVTLEEATR